MNPSRLASLLSQPWAIHPPYAQRMLGVLKEALDPHARDMHGMAAGVDMIPKLLAMATSRFPGLAAAFGSSAAVAAEVKPLAVNEGALSTRKLGVLKMSGPIVKGVSAQECRWYGLCDVDVIHRAAEAVKAEGIGHLILHLDSPGGMVCGIAEAADRLRGLREAGVTITAYTDTMACSAAYWLAAECDEIVASPSAIVGSIGCIILALDNSGLYSMFGLKPEYFVNAGSEAKLHGRPGMPFSEEARVSYQASVDAVGVEFKAFVSERRPGLAAADMNGDAWDAGTAPAGYVDHTHAGGRPVSTIGDLIGLLG